MGARLAAVWAACVVSKLAPKLDSFVHRPSLARNSLVTAFSMSMFMPDIVDPQGQPTPLASIVL
jgi:CRISPR/Cas system-associated endonuclease Cas1